MEEMYFKVRITCMNSITCIRSLVGQCCLSITATGPLPSLTYSATHKSEVGGPFDAEN